MITLCPLLTESTDVNYAIIDCNSFVFTQPLKAKWKERRKRRCWTMIRVSSTMHGIPDVAI